MAILTPDISLAAISPILILGLTACILLLGILVPILRHNGTVSTIAVLGYLGAIACAHLFGIDTFNPNGLGAFGTTISDIELAAVRLNGFSVFLIDLICIAGVITVLLSTRDESRGESLPSEYHALLLMSASGMVLMAMAQDWLLIFLGIEIMSMPIYVLVGIQKKQLVPTEASMKYFILGAFSSAIMLYGIALIYGARHTTNLFVLFDAYRTINSTVTNLPISRIGALLILSGLCFKVAAIPFHMWTPDAYQGAPSQISGFMSVAVKAAAFAVLLKFAMAFWGLRPTWTGPLMIVTTFTLILGNLMAIRQTNLKRMLAYSSIAHAGYILLAFIAYPEGANLRWSHSGFVTPVLVYIAIYTFMNLGAFGIAGHLAEKEEGQCPIDALAGLHQRSPFLAMLMAIFMFALAGLPPLAGFFGKAWLFWFAVQDNLWPFAVFAALGSAIGAYYYLRVVVVMYFHEPEQGVEHTSPFMPLAARVAVIATAACVIGFGLWPQYLRDWAEFAMNTFLLN